MFIPHTEKTAVVTERRFTIRRIGWEGKELTVRGYGRISRNKCDFETALGYSVAKTRKEDALFLLFFASCTAPILEYAEETSAGVQQQKLRWCHYIKERVSPIKVPAAKIAKPIPIPQTRPQSMPTNSAPNSWTRIERYILLLSSRTHRGERHDD